MNEYPLEPEYPDRTVLFKAQLEPTIDYEPLEFLGRIRRFLIGSAGSWVRPLRLLPKAPKHIRPNYRKAYKSVVNLFGFFFFFFKCVVVDEGFFFRKNQKQLIVAFF